MAKQSGNSLVKAEKLTCLPLERCSAVEPFDEQDETACGLKALGWARIEDFGIKGPGSEKEMVKEWVWFVGIGTIHFSKLHYPSNAGLSDTSMLQPTNQ